MEILTISIPLTSAIGIYILGRKIGYKGGKVISIITMIITTGISIKKYIKNIGGEWKEIYIKEWLNIGPYRSAIELEITREGVIMGVLIGIITTIVIIYSYWYLSTDAHINRYISYILLFSVSMYILVFSKNYLQMLIGWEGVGVVSYLLINYWYNSINNNKSSFKAILFNKVGDIAYIYGIIYLLSLHLSTNTSLVPSDSYIPLFYALILASMAKSAQILLHSWLGDAMAGPTPVSALLHAATMVTAGIYLLIKASPLRIPETEEITIIGEIIGIIGITTIVFGGLASINQYDIKKIIAYSTCGQIGYMYFALNNIQTHSSLYHLFTHGFFKALLFLSAGLLIHNHSLEQDIRKYGSFLHSFPLFYLSFFIGTLAIIGVPMMAGYYSKEIIIIQATTYKSINMTIILIIGSLLSSIYSLRLIYITFIKDGNKMTGTIDIGHNKWLSIIILLYIGSYTIGYLTNEVFSSPYQINLDTEINSGIEPLEKYIVVSLPIATLLYLLYSYLDKKGSRGFEKHPFKKEKVLLIVPYLNRRLYFDTFYNYFVSLPLLSLSYHLYYKCIERGILELLGPLGIIRLLYQPYGQLNINQQNINNLPFVFYYFLFSLFLFLFLLFLSS